MSAVLGSDTTTTIGNMLISCASFFVGAAGFALSVLAVLFRLVYAPQPTPDVVEYKRLSRLASRSPQLTGKHEKHPSISNNNVPVTPRSPQLTRKHEMQLSISSSNISTVVSSTYRSNSADSSPHPFSSIKPEEKKNSEKQVIVVTRSVDDPEGPLVDSPGTVSFEERGENFSRKKLCPCRAKDPSKRCVGKCCFKSLRKTSSIPSSLSPPASSSSSIMARKSQPRLRTQPYEAPYFFPTPDSVLPKRPPSRSQTLPPERKLIRSQTASFEVAAPTQTEITSSPIPLSPHPTLKRHATVVLPTTQH